jgi:hypothetical protein
MNKRNLLTLASAAVFLAASAAFAGTGLKLDEKSEVFQYGDSMYTWDPESGGAVWDGRVAETPERDVVALTR